MPLIVLVPLIILRLFFFGSFVLAKNEFGESGTHQFKFKKYDTQKSLPLYSVKEEFDDTKDSVDDQYNRSNILSNDQGHLYFESTRSGLSARIYSSNLRNLSINLYTNYIVFFNCRNLNV
jgi:hypothetical protein